MRENDAEAFFGDFEPGPVSRDEVSHQNPPKQVPAREDRDLTIASARIPENQDALEILSLRFPEAEIHLRDRAEEHQDDAGHQTRDRQAERGDDANKGPVHKIE